MQRKILVVDDESSNLEILRFFLSSLDFDVHEATTGKESLLKIGNSPYDVVLLDIMLPDISGYEICEKMKERTSNQLPVIFMSAKVQPEDIEKGFRHGADAYITKPFDFEVLGETLSEAIKV